MDEKSSSFDDSNVALEVGLKEKAEELYKKAIEVYEKAGRFEDAADVARKAGMKEKAEELYKKAIEVYEKAGMFEHAESVVLEAGMKEETKGAYNSVALRTGMKARAIEVKEKADSFRKAVVARNVGIKENIITSYEKSSLMDEKSSLLANLFDKKTVEILKKLLAKKDIFYLRDLSRETGVPLATTFRIVQKLVGMGLVGRERQDKFTWYKLNRDAPVFREISDLIIGVTPDPLAMFKSVLQEKFGAFFHAYVTKDKDKKVFIVTEVLKPQEVDEVAGKLSETAGGRPNYMVITPAFFEQMQAMGLVSKEKLSSL